MSAQTTNQSGSAGATTVKQEQSALSESERTRLLHKGALNQALALEPMLAGKLMAWAIVTANIERAQVQGDRVGAMVAIAQQKEETNDAAADVSTSTDTHSTAFVQTPSMQSTTSSTDEADNRQAVVKSEPVAIVKRGRAKIKDEPVWPAMDLDDLLI